MNKSTRFCRISPNSQILCILKFFGNTLDKHPEMLYNKKAVNPTFTLVWLSW